MLLAIYDDERFIRNDTFKQHCISLFVLHLVQLQRSLHVYVETEVVQLHCIAKRHEVLIASCHRQQHVGNNTPMRVIAASVAEYQSLLCFGDISDQRNSTPTLSTNSHCMTSY